LFKKNEKFVCFPSKYSKFDFGLKKFFTKENATGFYAKNHYFLKFFEIFEKFSKILKKVGY